MASQDHMSHPAAVRRLALLQVALTAGFLAIVGWLLGGLDAERPPWWLAGALVLAVVVGAVLAERVWLSTEPLAPDEPRAEELAIAVFATQTIRRLICCEAPILLGVVTAFVVDHGAWPLVVVGAVGLPVMAWATWPGLRHTSMTAAVLDSRGASSRLVENFRHT